MKRFRKFVRYLPYIIDNWANADYDNLVIINYWRRNHDENDEYINLLVNIFKMRERHIRITEYYESWIPRYLDYDFYSLYRMDKQTFYALLRAIDCPEKVYVGGEDPVPVEKALLMTLTWLGNGETLIRIGEIFNVAISTVFNCTECILARLIYLRQKYIVWPNPNEIPRIEMDFEARAGFPGVIGAIDVCNIKFKPPSNEQASYIDKNNNHSIKLQGVVTADKIFINVMAGFPGSVHDSRVLRNSKLYADIEENGNFRKFITDDRYHIVGDKAYPLKQWLMTPYRDNGRLTNQQRRYNTNHSVTRIVVEHTFGILKSRWKILKQINVNSIEKSVKIIVGCCVLHNFCYVNSDFWDEFEAIDHDNDVYENAADAPAAGINKRIEITNMF